MRDFLKPNMLKAKSGKFKLAKSKLGSSSLALLALLGFSETASAQDTVQAPDGFRVITDLAGVQDITTQADGSVDVTFSNGQTVNFPASDVSIVQGEVFLEEGALDAAGLLPAAGGANLLLIGGVIVAGAGIAAALAGGGGGDDDAAPAPAPEPVAPTPNDAPVITNVASFSVAENSTSAFTATATDANNDALTYSLTGADAELFAIDSASGLVTFDPPADFEAPSDSGADNVYDVTVNVTDGSDSVTQDVAITVTDANESSRSPERQAGLYLSHLGSDPLWSSKTRHMA